MPTPSGALKLFTFRGIRVYLHWTWVVVAYFMLKYRYNTYSQPAWALAEYVALFAIVLLHEFGHSLACRQTGGRADTIMLWPLGGVAFVRPPERPGAQLWSIVAGPLVNFVLIAPTVAASWWYNGGFDGSTRGDFGEFLFIIAIVNFALLIFNLLPVYPLDGGQILRSVLWFMIGPINSLLVASMIGVAASAIGLLVTLRLGMVWMSVMAGFALWQSLAGFQRARAWLKWQNIPRHAHAACPNCAAHPLAVPGWRCDQCQTSFDMIATAGQCPRCGVVYDGIPCPDCGKLAPANAWLRAAVERV
jgi:Zn-dependent protease